MLSKEEYVSLSLETHLFWGRIMKEHSLFLEAGFTPKNTKLAKQADNYKIGFEKLLFDILKLNRGGVRKVVLESGEIFTKYTLDAEKKTSYYTGIEISQKITVLECERTKQESKEIDSKMVNSVKSINIKAMKLLDGLIKLKKIILDGVSSCNIFTVNYPMLLEHVIEEAQEYHLCIEKLENSEELNSGINQKKSFWNEIMREHSLFIRGLLDPSEEELICTSNKFAEEFNKLIEQSRNIVEIIMADDLNDSLRETIKLRDFKISGTEGILNCEIKSIILPLLSDHVLREANHYIRLLKECKR